MIAENKEIRQQYFDKICPPLYRDTDVKRLPAEAFKRVMGWEPGSEGRGLYLLGPAGTGKTRCMWQLIERITLTSWTNVRVFDSLVWQIQVSRAFGNPDTTEEWFERVCDAPILFIDDMFKGKMTDAQSHAAHGVLERRSAYRRPTFCTSNVDGDNLSSRVIEPTTAESILRRITEFCDVVEFTG
jgi:primosomal protein DnaI